MSQELTTDIITVEKNEGGIPGALFIEDIEKFCNEHKIMPDTLQVLLNELYKKYKFIETSLNESLEAVLTKIPENDKSKQAIELLKAKKEEEEVTKATFNMSHNLFVSSEIQPTDKCCLWLGAGCMVEVTLDEGLEILTNIKAKLEENEKELERDIDFVAEQSTVVELNIRRTHNYMVRIKQEVVKNSIGK